MDLQLSVVLLGFSLLEPQSWLMILLGALGLSVVIFVHELGHFLVAKLCGVKCEKFYIGFDINGYKLFKFQWGETEYGIGVLPLGGYVKMLGQEDNPARVQEEMERAKVSGEGGGTGFQLDPRSYLAQSVPERMAIISAGVVMNIIFAFIFASIAYGMGVEQQPCVIRGVVPGETAWQAGLRPGDRILKINGQPVVAFRDLTKNVALGDIENGVEMEVQRAGSSESVTVVVHPKRVEGALTPRIGAAPPVTNQLNPHQATIPGTPAAVAEPSLEPGDTIVAVGDQPIASYVDLLAVLTQHPSEPLELTVSRKTGQPPDSRIDKVRVTVPPNPVKWIGIVTDMGPIAAVQLDSPAAHAGLKEGDVLLSLNGQPIADPLRLPEQLRQMAGQTVAVEFKRAGQADSSTVELIPNATPWFEVSGPGTPMSAPTIGIAYRIGSKVVAVQPGSLAEKAGIKPGDVVESALAIQPKKLELDKAWHDDRETTLDFKGDKLNWPWLFFLVQHLAPGSKIELSLAGDRKVTLEPEVMADWYYPERGFAYDALTTTRTAESFAEAVRLGKEETVDSLLLVVRFLRKLSTRQVSPMSMGGPGTIFAAAGASAEAGMAHLLLFLCMLSANLAVINFLPIPVLDGGHMMFLAYEGIFRKPITEKWFMRLTYAGFAFILMLMIFCIGLDVNRGIELVQSWLQ